jgi:hypothetical protein
MSLPELKSAELGGIEGTGYAFTTSTFDGDAIQGIFFADEATEGKAEALIESEAVPFSGVLYKRNRSGSVTQKKVDLDVDVTKMSSVAFGDRLDFIVVEESD